MKRVLYLVGILIILRSYQGSVPSFPCLFIFHGKFSINWFFLFPHNKRDCFGRKRLYQRSHLRFLPSICNGKGINTNKPEEPSNYPHNPFPTPFERRHRQDQLRRVRAEYRKRIFLLSGWTRASSYQSCVRSPTQTLPIPVLTNDNKTIQFRNLSWPTLSDLTQS